MVKKIQQIQEKLGKYYTMIGTGYFFVFYWNQKYHYFIEDPSIREVLLYHNKFPYFITSACGFPLVEEKMKPFVSSSESTPIKEFDLRKFLDDPDYVRELMESKSSVSAWELQQSVFQICEKSQIPFFFALVERNTDGQTYYRSVYDLFGKTDEQIERFVSILNGMKTVWKTGEIVDVEVVDSDEEEVLEAEECEILWE